jgi:bla regulator protein blaR1
MKKLSLIALSLVFCIISITAQTGKTEPLILINGKISSVSLNSLRPDQIESISITKSPSANDFRKYGALSSNGIISVKTNDDFTTQIQKDYSSRALVVVDGKVYTSSLDSINVRDVESVSVLKGISATKKYGNAGEHGVIQITLKVKPGNGTR